MIPLNLDQRAAQHARKIVENCVPIKDAKAAENLITKTLGVLQEQGVYASVLYLFSRSSDEGKIAQKLRVSLFSLLKELPRYESDPTLAGFGEYTKAQPVLNFYAEKVCDDLDTLLLVKELYEQVLIYARYGAKAEGK